MFFLTSCSLFASRIAIFFYKKFLEFTFIPPCEEIAQQNLFLVSSSFFFFPSLQVLIT